ncbi:hypothetical protein K8T06_05815, partial [bacterium]|nr:hypothetical protein [bacterium]
MRSVTGKIIIITFFSLIILSIIILCTKTSYVNDDAVISYKYAWNIARGYGSATWPGGFPEEGFSNPLLVYATAVLSIVSGYTSLHQVIATGMIINHLAAIGLLLIIVGYAVTSRKHMAAWLAPLILVLSPPLAYYLNSGLETPLYTFFLTGLVLSLFKNHTFAAALCALGTATTRTEGIIIVAIIWSVHLFSQHRSQNKTIQRKSFLALGVTFIVFGLLLIGKWRYFGYFLPNPLLVKGQISERGTFDGRGIYYIIQNFKSYPLYFALLIPFCAEIFRKKNIWYYLPLVAVIAAQTVFIIMVGGDEPHLGLSRFILPVFPLIILMASIRISEIKRIEFRAVLFALYLIICLTSYRYQLPSNPVNTLRVQWHRWMNPSLWLDAEAGRFIAGLTGDEGRGLAMASAQAGSLPVYWEGEFIDLIGLTTRRYAGLLLAEKNKQFVEDQPDVIMAFRWTGGWFAVPSVAVLKEMNYRPYIIVQLLRTADKSEGPRPYTINFLVFVKNKEIFK